jgi:hypothetical protein
MAQSAGVSIAADIDPAQRLLYAVRHRLWRAQFAGALRFALWCSAVSMLVFAAVAHLAQVAVSLQYILLSLAAVWVSLSAWAVLQRPSQADCALWADRHLGGASAYSTLLEMRGAAKLRQRTEALRRLEQWAAAHALRARKLLAAQREPAYLLRPFFSMLLAAGIAGLLLKVPGVAPTARPDVAASPKSTAAEGATADGPPLVSPRQGNELAKALRLAASRDAHDGVRQQQGTTGGPGTSDETGPANTASRSGATSATRTFDREASVTRGTDAPATYRSSGSGAGLGSAAGDSRDERASVAGAGAPSGAIKLHLRESGAKDATTAKQADMMQPGLFDHELRSSAEPRSRIDRLALPATPPTAASNDTLAPAEAAYVEAWLKTTAERR